MAWQESPGPSRSRHPGASVRRNGQLGFNSGAVTRYELDQFGFALLYYDEENRRIGVKLMEEKVPRSFTFVHRTGDAYISAQSFFEHFRIPLPQETTKYDLVKEGEMLVINLTAPRVGRNSRGEN